jgi:pimeloyl-ACP methyl ester carboxylesterase
MKYSLPAEDFRLAYDRIGSGASVVLLHGWPGDHTDYRKLVPLLAGSADVLTPDLRGFGLSDKHLVDPEKVYSAARASAHFCVILAIWEDLRLGPMDDKTVL